LFASKSKYSRRGGWTLAEASKQLLARGAVDAILIDEGGDVYQYLLGEDYKQLPPARGQVRAMFILGSKGPILT